MISNDTEYKARWSEEEIPELISHAYDVLEIEIPLATDIRKTVEFLQACRLIGRDDKDRMCLIADIRTEVKYKIRFMPSRFSKSTEFLPIPEDVLMCAYNGVRQILDNKCDYLAKISCYKHSNKL